MLRCCYRKALSAHKPHKTAVVVSDAKHAAQRLMTPPHGTPGFGADTLSLVQFSPQSIYELPLQSGSKYGEPLAFPFTVTFEASNAVGSAHGGVIATLADVFTTVHLWGIEPSAKHVSAGLDIKYLNAAPLNASMLCMSHVQRLGRSLAFVQFEFVDTKTMKSCAKGTHTKYILPEKFAGHDKTKDLGEGD